MREAVTLGVPVRWDQDRVPALLKEQRETAMLVSESFAIESVSSPELHEALADLVAEMERICALFEAQRPDPAGEYRPGLRTTVDAAAPSIVLARRFGRAHQRLAAVLRRAPIRADPPSLAVGGHDDDFERFARLRLLTRVLVTYLDKSVTPERASRWSF